MREAGGRVPASSSSSEKVGSKIISVEHTRDGGVSRLSPNLISFSSQLNQLLYSYVEKRYEIGDIWKLHNNNNNNDDEDDVRKSGQVDT